MNYWEESVRECLSELDIALPEEKIAALVKGIRMIREMECEATGSYLIPNPETIRAAGLERRIEELKGAHESEIRAHQDWISKSTGSPRGSLAFKVSGNNLEVERWR